MILPQQLRRNRKTLVVFVISLIFLPLATFLLAVLLPVITSLPEEPAIEDSKASDAGSTKSKPTKAAAKQPSKNGKKQLPENSTKPSPKNGAKPSLKNEEKPPSTTTTTQHESRRSSEKIASLQIAEAFEQARLQLATSEAISLSVDVVDKFVNLEIKGVLVRHCKIHRYKITGPIRHLRARRLLHRWLSTPFILQKEWATLPKAPIRVKEAPKDPTEAEQMATEEIPVETGDVYVRLEFDRNLNLSMSQVESPSFNSRWQNTLSNLRQTLKTTQDALRPSKQSKNRVWIELQLFREDAKAIYRALPQNAGMALRL